MMSGPHRQVMPRLLDWCDEAALVHWRQDTDRERDWYEAHQRLQQEGRLSKVRYPSLAHERFDIPRPRNAAKNSQQA
jgi:hypothetical protein